MFPVMASEPKMDVSNVQSCSHEKELFVLPLQTEEKMGFHLLLGCLYVHHVKLKIKGPRIEPRFQTEQRPSLNQPVLVHYVCVQCSCLCV